MEEVRFRLCQHPGRFFPTHQPYDAKKGTRPVSCPGALWGLVSARDYQSGPQLKLLATSVPRVLSEMNMASISARLSYSKTFRVPGAPTPEAARISSVPSLL